MYDQSINKNSLINALRRSDFHRVYDLRDEILRNVEIQKSITCANIGSWIASPLRISELRGKKVYALARFSDELLVRKINNNIRHFKKINSPARTSIISNLSRIVSEGVGYRIYRLDVKSFFESFKVSNVLKMIDDIEILSLVTKRLVRDLFRHFIADGGSGIPRGLAISSTLSELMMANFDLALKNKKEVFFYARYVDDIIIVTDGKEAENSFINAVELLLPDGLHLSKKKKDVIYVPKVAKNSSYHFNFEYLGYKFDVKDVGVKDAFRKVLIWISRGKINKIKTRMSLAFKDYCRTKNFSVLHSRIKFLCGNFSMDDRDKGKKRLSGIYYNYHLIDPSSQDCGLHELDRYLQSSVISGNGKISSAFKASTTKQERYKLLRISFKHGFKTKVFLHYRGKTLSEIQECWKYA